MSWQRLLLILRAQSPGSWHHCGETWPRVMGQRWETQWLRPLLHTTQTPHLVDSEPKWKVKLKHFGEYLRRWTFLTPAQARAFLETLATRKTQTSVPVEMVSFCMLSGVFLVGVLQGDHSLSLFLLQASFNSVHAGVHGRQPPDSFCHQCLPATLTKELSWVWDFVLGDVFPRHLQAVHSVSWHPAQLTRGQVPSDLRPSAGDLLPLSGSLDIFSVAWCSRISLPWGKEWTCLSPSLVVLVFLFQKVTT